MRIQILDVFVLFMRMIWILHVYVCPNMRMSSCKTKIIFVWNELKCPLILILANRIQSTMKVLDFVEVMNKVLYIFTHTHIYICTCMSTSWLTCDHG